MIINKLKKYSITIIIIYLLLKLYYKYRFNKIKNDFNYKNLKGNIGLIPLIDESILLATTPLQDFVLNKIKEYDDDIFISKYFGVTYLFCQSKELIHQLLTKDNDYLHPGWDDARIKLLGENAVTVVTHKKHTYLRKILANAMNKSILDNWCPVASKIFNKLMLEWKNSNKFVNVSIESRDIVWEMTKVLFMGENYNNNKANIIKNALSDYGAGFFAIPMDSNIFMETEYGKALKAKNVLENLLKEEINRRLNLSINEQNKYNDILSSLMLELKPTSDNNMNPLTVDELAAASVGPLWGSLDSTANLISLA